MYDTKNIFKGTNPNRKIFIVDGEEGVDGILEQDNRHSMIGDATMKHQSELGFNRHLLDEFFCMPDGSLFSTFENPKHDIISWKEMDPKDAVDFLVEKGMTEPEAQKAVDGYFTEDKEDSDIMDTYDRASTDIENFDPSHQMLNDDNIPSTPKDIVKYCGNAMTEFYDSFPEGHPQASTMRMLLFVLKSNLNNALDPYEISFFGKSKTFDTWVEYFNEHMLPFMYENGAISCKVMLAFMDIAGFIKGTYPTPEALCDFIELKLKEIDEDYGEEIRLKALHDGLIENKLFGEMYALDLELEEYAKKDGRAAASIERFNTVKRAGVELFEKTNKIKTSGHERGQAALAWWKYRIMKTSYAPKLIIGGIDINRTFHSDVICDRIGFSKKQAQMIVSRLLNDRMVRRTKHTVTKEQDGMFSISEPKFKVILEGGPFSSIEEVYKFIGEDKDKFVTNDQKQQLDNIFSIIDTRYEAAVKHKQLNRFLTVAPDLIRNQRKGKLTNDLEVWKKCWSYYRSCKESIVEESKKWSRR